MANFVGGLVASVCILALSGCSWSTVASASSCDSNANVTLTKAMVEDLTAIIRKKISDDVANDTEGRPYNPLVPGFLRLIFHVCSARRCSDYVDMANPINVALPRSMAAIDEIWDSLKGNATWRGFSKADLIALAGAVAFKVATGSKASVTFRYGRSDFCEGDNVTELGVELPLPGFGTGDVRSYFRKIFNFTEHEIVAIMGAHSSGVVHGIASVKPTFRWTNNNPSRLSNEYYKLLLKNTWRQKPRQLDGIPFPLKLWVRPSVPRRIMLNSDLGQITTVPVKNMADATAQCATYLSCNPEHNKAQVKRYARDQMLFFKDFAAAFQKMIENGLSGKLQNVQP